MGKELAVVFNSPYLGGAEISTVHQALLTPETTRIHFYIPWTHSPSEASALSLFVREKGFDFTLVPYGSNLFGWSRSGGAGNILFSVIEMMELYLSFRSAGLGRHDCVWCNGNKVGLPLFLFFVLSLFKGRLVWHFRDYPATTGLFSKVWRMFKVPWKFSWCLVGNSHSVSDALRKLAHPRVPVHTIYNPVGSSSLHRTLNDPLSIIGVVGMIAPWKGQDQIFDLLDKYDDQLHDLGYREIRFYGEPLYSTDGEHRGWIEKLKSLQCHYHGKIRVSFMGNIPPEEILPCIDVLLHTTVRPEPFGRVITEAFSAGVPVVSTAMGGASELVIDGVTGFVFRPGDLASLFSALEKLSSGQGHLKGMLDRAMARREQVEDEIAPGLSYMLAG